MISKQYNMKFNKYMRKVIYEMIYGSRTQKHKSEGAHLHQPVEYF